MHPMNPCGGSHTPVNPTNPCGVSSCARDTTLALAMPCGGPVIWIYANFGAKDTALADLATVGAGLKPFRKLAGEINYATGLQTATSTPVDGLAPGQSFYLSAIYFRELDDACKLTRLTLTLTLTLATTLLLVVPVSNLLPGPGHRM